MKYTVVHAKRYAFTDEKTGRALHGAKVTVLDQYKELSDDKGLGASRGREPLVIDASFDVYEQLIKIPADYEFDVATSTKKGSNGQTLIVLKLESARMVEGQK
jgi:hypothetical protein